MTATYTIPEVAALLGISRNVAYEAARSGELAGVPVIRIGARRLVIPRAPIDQLLGFFPDHTTTTDNATGISA